MTSRALLFCKDNCGPCQVTKDFLDVLLTEVPALGNYITVMDKDNHTALVGIYGLDKFPSLLMVDSDGEEIARLVGGQLVREDLRGVLFALRAIDR